MSAIRELIESCQANRDYTGGFGLGELADAAEEELLERDHAEAQLLNALEDYKHHEISQDPLVREVFRWGEGLKAPIAPDREAQVQREAEEFYGKEST